jgi:lipopolysaccharide/colanic/teichoic acid biosynthesis glycosyltransferase
MTGSSLVGCRPQVGNVARSCTTHGRRWLDLGIALPALLLASPLLVAIAITVRVSSPGPAFFCQVRVGRDHRLFRIWKFRTMDAGVGPTPGGGPGRPAGRVMEDNRVTRVGRVLRQTSLDELPQLFNVLHGSMSLVGPRPLVSGDCDRLHDVSSRAFARRLTVPPGITGLAQVSGRRALTPGAVLALDLWYVKHRSLRLDLWILVRTVGVVLSRRGAY